MNYKKYINEYRLYSIVVVMHRNLTNKHSTVLIISRNDVDDNAPTKYQKKYF